MIIVFEDGYYLGGDSLLKVNFEHEFNSKSNEKIKVHSVKLKGSK